MTKLSENLNALAKIPPVDLTRFAKAQDGIGAADYPEHKLTEQTREALKIADPGQKFKALHGLLKTDSDDKLIIAREMSKLLPEIFSGVNSADGDGLKVKIELQQNRLTISCTESQCDKVKAEAERVFGVVSVEALVDMASALSEDKGRSREKRAAYRYIAYYMKLVQGAELEGSAEAAEKLTALFRRHVPSELRSRIVDAERSGDSDRHGVKLEKIFQLWAHGVFRNDTDTESQEIANRCLAQFNILQRYEAKQALRYEAIVAAEIFASRREAVAKEERVKLKEGEQIYGRLTAGLPTMEELERWLATCKGREAPEIAALRIQIWDLVEQKQKERKSQQEKKQPSVVLREKAEG